MRALSEDLRERIVAARAAGDGRCEVARRFCVSVGSVDRYWKRFRELGHVRKGKHGGHLRSRLEGHEQTVKEWIEKENDMTLAELCARLKKQLGVKLGPSALWYRLDGMELTYKKSDSCRRTRASRRKARSRTMARYPGQLGCFASRLPGLNRRQYEDDSPLRT